MSFQIFFIKNSLSLIYLFNGIEVKQLLVKHSNHCSALFHLMSRTVVLKNFSARENYQEMMNQVRNPWP